MPSKKMKREFPETRGKENEFVTIPGDAVEPFLKVESKALNTKNVHLNKTLLAQNEVKTKPVEVDPTLFGTEKVADLMRQVFEFDRFNKVQTECFHLIYETDENAVISAPTGSGKTALFELAICRLYQEFMGSGSQAASDTIRSIYIVPMKALCQERYQDWSTRFAKVGIRVMELTGDTENDVLGALSRVHIILTTPEKWDSFTRKWKDHRYVMKGIRLMMIDEVHLLNTDRGATLEAIVARMQSIANMNAQKLRSPTK